MVGSRGSPTFSAAARSPSVAANGSTTERSTTSRSVDMQIWPWCMNAPNFAAATASSRSASASTTIGALPPSSSSTGFRCRAAFSATSRPTRVEPVKLIRRTAGWAISSSTTSGASPASCVSRLTTPGGRPASSSARAISAWVRGHTSDAFRTTVLPYASGVATARVPRITGAFQGAMPTTTPAGRRTAIAVKPGTSEGITSPATAYTGAAASFSIPAASAQLNIPHPNVPPVSAVTIAAMPSARSIRSAAAACSSLRRAAGGVAAHAGNACAAASAAARASSRFAAAALPAGSPVNGSVFSNEPPALASLHSPPISSRWASSCDVATGSLLTRDCRRSRAGKPNYQLC